MDDASFGLAAHLDTANVFQGRDIAVRLGVRTSSSLPSNLYVNFIAYSCT